MEISGREPGRPPPWPARPACSLTSLRLARGSDQTYPELEAKPEDGREVLFTPLPFTSLDAIRSFAGDDYEEAVVEDAARQALSRWDERVSHHQVAAELE